MARVRITPIGEGSRLDIWQYIARDNPEAADALIDQIDAASEQYARQPLMGEIREELGHELRSFTVGKYVVIYRPADDGIVVLLVIHGARDVPAVFRSLFHADMN